MKFLLFILLFPLQIFATNYYVSSTGNDANPGTINAPWRSLVKVNTMFASLQPGDSILFKRGESFYGSLIASRSGTLSNKIVISFYGTGSNPTLSGFTTASGWGNNIGGVWQVNTNAKANLNNVIVNGTQVALGRFPNTGFLNYQSVGTLNYSITDNQLTSSPNWTGAKAVIRKLRWIYDICPISSHIGTTINYTQPVGTDNNYRGIAGYGYFIQDDARTLDIPGEWFLNKTTKVLSMYFGSAQTGVVKYSTVDTVINLGNYNNIVVDGITIEGANVFGVYAMNGNNITLTNCSIINSGGVGVHFWNIPNTVITYNTITNTLSNGIFCNNRTADNTQIIGNTINNASYLVGMDASGDNTGNGIFQNGNNCTIQLNTVTNTGYNGIQFQGNNILVDKNVVTSYCNNKNDGGGIYSWAVDGTATFSNRVVSNNIVLNAGNATAGTSTPNEIDARGLYADGGTNNVLYSNNTVINSDAGAYLNNTVNVTLRGNTFFNVKVGVNINRFNNSPLVRNTNLVSNISHANTSNIVYWNARLNNPPQTIQADIRAIGIVDSNVYRAGIVDEFDWYFHQNADSTPDGYSNPPSMTFAPWKFFSNYDTNSTNFEGSFTLFYNASNTPLPLNISGTWVDVKGQSFNSYTLQPFSSVLLKQTAQANNENLLIISGIIFVKE